MSELMKKILADKLKTRKRLANLPFEQKLTLMEKMRDRGLLIAANSLRVRRHSIMPFVVVSGDGVGLSGLGAHTGGLMPLAVRQLPDQSNILQNSETLFAELNTRSERWHVTRLEQVEPEFESPSQA